MSEMTNTHELAFLDFWFNDTAFTKPTILEVSWHTASPTDTGSVANESDVNGGGPTGREQVTFADSTGGARQVANTNQVDIASSSVTATITHWGIHNGVNGPMLAYAALDSPLSVTTGAPVRINIGGMVWDFPAAGNPIYTDWLVDRWMSHVFGATDYNAARPSNWFTSLHDGVPGETGLNEFTAGSYARISTNYDPAGAATSGDTTQSWVRNTAQLNWTNLSPGGEDPNITHWGVWDSLTTGQFLARFQQSSSPVSNGSNAAAAAQALELRAG